MQDALHLKTTVLPGKRIELTDPQLSEGAEIDVFLVLPGSKARRSALDIINEIRSRGIFRSKKEIDDQLKQ
ncbi:MAG: hypothetical protein ABFD69_06935 [Candidatus Sumerlaeia bacterium]